MARDRPSTVEERVAAIIDDLSPSVATVARYILDQWDRVLFLSAADIAAELDVSDATVIRTTQALGYSGLPELKTELRSRLDKRQPAFRYSRTLDAPEERREPLLSYVVGGEIEYLKQIPDSISAHAIDAALTLLDAADRIAVLSIGPSDPLIDHFALTVRRVGRNVLHLHGSDATFPDRLLELQARDVLVVVAYERVTRPVRVALDHASSVGMSTILITDHLALALEDQITVALAAERGSPEFVTAGTVPLAILQTLALGLVEKDRPRALASLARLQDLRDRLQSE